MTLSTTTLLQSLRRPPTLGTSVPKLIPASDRLLVADTRESCMIEVTSRPAPDLFDLLRRNHAAVLRVLGLDLRPLASTTTVSDRLPT
jgi:hypothetical protein